MATLPIYYLSISKIPVGVAKTLVRLHRDFLGMEAMLQPILIWLDGIKCVRLRTADLEGSLGVGMIVERIRRCLVNAYGDFPAKLMLLLVKLLKANLTWMVIWLGYSLLR